MNWVGLKSKEQLDLINQISFEKPQIIFKHSTQCNISADAYKEMSQMEATAWYLDLLANRDVSNLIAEMYDVKHQSPQVIIIKDGQAIYNESHWRIKTDLVQEALER